MYGENWGLEVPLVFAPPGFVETPTLGRSNAFPIVAEEVEAVRTAAGAYEIAQYARYEVSGAGAEAWLDRLLAGRMPDVGRIRLSPMLNEAGRLMGDLSVTRLGDDRFWLTGSYYLQDWHMRWFDRHQPGADVEIENITDSCMGFAVSGPASREILAGLTDEDVSDEGLRFMAVREMRVGSRLAVVGRLSLTGELGYEIVVPAADELVLWHELGEAGAAHGLRPIGDYAVDSLRLEKGYGIWNAEFTQRYTPGDVRPRSVRRMGQGSLRRPRGGDAGTRGWPGPATRVARGRCHRRRGRRRRRHLARRPPRRLRDLGRVRAPRGGEPRARLRRSRRDRVELRSSASPSSARSRPCRILPEPPYDPQGRRIRELAIASRLADREDGIEPTPQPEPR